MRTRCSEPGRWRLQVPSRPQTTEATRASPLPVRVGLISVRPWVPGAYSAESRLSACLPVCSSFPLGQRCVGTLRRTGFKASGVGLAENM